MLQNKQNLLLLLILFLIGYMLFTTQGIQTDVKEYKQKIEQLQQKVDSAKIADKKLVYKIDSVQQKVFGISKEIYYIDKNINIIKKQTDEKINSVDTLTTNELEQFFTDRYNKSSN